jgi:hypothetical protein
VVVVRSRRTRAVLLANSRSLLFKTDFLANQALRLLRVKKISNQVMAISMAAEEQTAIITPSQARVKSL